MEQNDNIPNENLEDTQKDRYLTFFIGKESYGIEIQYVIEIIGLQSITEVPEQPDYIKGIINLRGKIIPVFDMRIRFKKETIFYTERTCIVIININKMLVGLIVDGVSEVISIPETDIIEPPEMNYSSNNKYIQKIGKIGAEVKLLIDCEKLIGKDGLQELSKK